jgi:hypothetical protein
MKNKFKIFVVFVGCLLFRLIPLRAPNIEPLMASIMPITRKCGAFMGFAFGFLSIFLYDALTHFGAWTWTAGITYGFVGVASFFYFKKSQSSILNFAVFAFFTTVVYDLITGVLFAPMFGQTILNALVMQIPFTALHLAGNIGFAVTLSPLIDKWLASNEFFSLRRRRDSNSRELSPYTLSKRAH